MIIDMAFLKHEWQGKAQFVCKTPTDKQGTLNIGNNGIRNCKHGRNIMQSGRSSNQILDVTLYILEINIMSVM